MIVNEKFWETTYGKVFRYCTESVAKYGIFRLKEEEGYWVLYKHTGTILGPNKHEKIWERVCKRDLKDGIGLQIRFKNHDDGLEFIRKIRNLEVPFVFPDTVFNGISDG